MKKQLLMSISFLAVGFFSCALLLASSNLNGERSIGEVWRAANMTVSSILEGAQSDESIMADVGGERAMPEEQVKPLVKPVERLTEQAPARPRSSTKKANPLDAAWVREVERVHLKGVLAQAQAGERTSGPSADVIAIHKQVAKLNGVKQSAKSESNGFAPALAQ